MKRTKCSATDMPANRSLDFMWSDDIVFPNDWQELLPGEAEYIKSSLADEKVLDDLLEQICLEEGILIDIPLSGTLRKEAEYNEEDVTMGKFFECIWSDEDEFPSDRQEILPGEVKYNKSGLSDEKVLADFLERIWSEEGFIFNIQPSSTVKKAA